MNKFLLAALLSLMASCTPALADEYGNGIIPTGTTKQIGATSTSASNTLGDSHGGYVVVWNEGSVFAYVTCNSSVATVPGGAGPNSTPVGPSGGMILYKPANQLSCAAITASSTTTVDFTPVNLF